jgi:hypothetical protein
LVFLSKGRYKEGRKRKHFHIFFFANDINLDNME